MFHFNNNNYYYITIDPVTPTALVLLLAPEPKPIFEVLLGFIIFPLYIYIYILYT